MLKRGLRLLMALALALGVGLSLPARAHAESKQVDTTITNFEIQNLEEQKVDSVYHSDTFYLAMDWDASKSGMNIHAGDYFDVTLPDNMRFPSDTTAREFDLKDDDGNVVAHATVNPGEGDAGGTVHVVFSDAAENRYNIQGTIHLAAQFDEDKLTMDAPNTFTVKVNGEVADQPSSTSATVIGAHSNPDEHLAKWGVEDRDNPNQAQWEARVNLSKSPLAHATVADSLSDKSQTYIAGSFTLRKVNFDDYGAFTDADTLQTWTNDELVESGMLTIAPDGTSFTLNLGDTSDSYFLQYETTYTPGTTLRNDMTLTGGDEPYEVHASHHSAASGGTGRGDASGTIKIVKVGEDGTTPLAGAVFTVTKPDGSTFELTTGTDGTVTSGYLEQGEYKVKEKTAPIGYELDDQEYTLTVDGQTAAVQTISDRPIRTSVKVTKAWVGPQGGPVTVHLLANGTDTGETLTLSADNSWTGSFDGLRAYDEDGNEVAYTVAEDPVDSYSSAVTGDAASGFTITNTYTPPKSPTPPTSPESPESDVPPAPGQPDNNLPQTSDDSGSLMTTAGVAALAAIGCIVVAARLRRREQ